MPSAARNAAAGPVQDRQGQGGTRQQVTQAGARTAGHTAKLNNSATHVDVTDIATVRELGPLAALWSRKISGSPGSLDVRGVQARRRPVTEAPGATAHGL